MSEHSAHRSRLMAYGALITTFEIGLTLVAKRRNVSQGRLGWGDFLRLALATHQIAKLVANEPVTRVVREPFVEDEHDGEERPASGALRGAIGELVTCPYCLGPWTALVLTAGHAFAPGWARSVTSLFSVVAVADFLHQGNALLREKTNVARALAEASQPA